LKESLGGGGAICNDVGRIDVGVFSLKNIVILFFIFLLFKMLGFDIINLIFCLYKKENTKQSRFFLKVCLINITGDNKIFWRQNSN